MNVATMLETLLKKGQELIGVIGSLAEAGDALIGKVKGETYVKTYLEREFLNRAELITIAREHILPGADEIALIREEHKDKHYLVLIYLSGGAFLPKEKDERVVICCDHLSRDVMELFAGDQVVILK